MHGTTVALGLGSNLGNSVENLRRALSAVKNLKNFKIEKVSSIFESDAQVPANAPDEWNSKYLNAVILVKVAGAPDPLEWLRQLKVVEKTIGRKDTSVWAPREIDIDILYWGHDDFTSAELSVPHRRLLERPFALLPLLEVWPELRQELSSRLPSWSREWVDYWPFNTKISDYVWPRLVGILNITPDSFSDGGKWTQESEIEKQLQFFIDNKVEIVDVGAESTRPGAAIVTREEEYRRLQKFFEVLKRCKTPQISLDCRNADVAAKVISEYQVDYLNDVSGFDSMEMLKLLKETGKKAFVMHSLSIPPTKEKVIDLQQEPHSLLVKWWNQKISIFQEVGIKIENLIFDPGIGFGKSAAQSFYILNHLEKFYEIKNEIMIGHSRKSFQTVISGRPPTERDLETALISEKLNPAYVQYLRVHEPVSQMVALRARSYL